MHPTLGEKVESKIERIPESGCWIWMGYVNELGYGTVQRRGRGTMSIAHRVSYELIKGAIPEGLALDHLCRVRCCVNPDHLEPVTQYENIMRGEGWGAKNARKTHCVHGHPFDDENTIITKNGRRRCRSCKRAGMSKYRHEQRGAMRGA